MGVGGVLWACTRHAATPSAITHVWKLVVAPRIPPRAPSSWPVLVGLRHHAQAPWMLCAGEVSAVLLIYFLATSRSLVLHQRHFSFTRSLEDVVGICCTRAAILSLSYAIGQRYVHR